MFINNEVVSFDVTIDMWKIGNGVTNCSGYEWQISERETLPGFPNRTLFLAGTFNFREIYFNTLMNMRTSRLRPNHVIRRPFPNHIEGNDTAVAKWRNAVFNRRIRQPGNMGVNILALDPPACPGAGDVDCRQPMLRQQPAHHRRQWRRRCRLIQTPYKKK